MAVTEIIILLCFLNINVFNTANASFFSVGLKGESAIFCKFGNYGCSIRSNNNVSLLSTEVGIKHKMNPVLQNMNGNDVTDDSMFQLENMYLDRIGISELKMQELRKRSPNVHDLQYLYICHLQTVPFENMDLHEHPAALPEFKKIPRCDPTLVVEKSLNKIVHMKRGGFCFEVNFSFSWLLRRLGYNVRLALADVGCTQATTPGKAPAHVVLLIDNLNQNNDCLSEENNVVYLVDPGFGNPGVCELALPLVYDSPVVDRQGDIFEFQTDKNSTTDGTRFDSVLLRTRITSIGEQSAMYRFCSQDDLEYLDSQFEQGLEYVLTKSSLFNDKRICVLSTPGGGHCTLGSDYIKWIEKGLEVKRLELPTESTWREALHTHFKISLENS